MIFRMTSRPHQDAYSYARNYSFWLPVIPEKVGKSKTLIPKTSSQHVKHAAKKNMEHVLQTYKQMHNEKEIIKKKLMYLSLSLSLYIYIYIYIYVCVKKRNN